METAKAYCVALVCMLIPISLICFQTLPPLVEESDWNPYWNETIDLGDENLKTFGLQEIGTQDIVVTVSPYVYKIITEIQTILDTDTDTKWYCWTELFVGIVGATQTILKVMIYASKSMNKDYTHEYSYEYTPSETLVYGGSPYVPFQMKLYIRDSDGATSFELGFVFMHLVEDTGDGTYDMNFDMVDLTIYADGVTAKDIATNTILITSGSVGVQNIEDGPFDLIDIFYDVTNSAWVVLWCNYLNNGAGVEAYSLHTLDITNETNYNISSIDVNVYIFQGYYDPITDYYKCGSINSASTSLVLLKIRYSSYDATTTLITLDEALPGAMFSKTTTNRIGKIYCEGDIEIILTNYIAYIYNPVTTEYDYLNYSTKGIDPSFGNSQLTFSSTITVNKYPTYRMFVFARNFYKFNTRTYWGVLSYREADPEVTSIILSGDVVNLAGIIYEFIPQTFEPKEIKLYKEYLKPSRLSMMVESEPNSYIELYDDSDNLIFFGKSSKGWENEGTQYNIEYNSYIKSDLDRKLEYTFTAQTVSEMLATVIADTQFLTADTIDATTNEYTFKETRTLREFLMWCDKAEGKISTIKDNGEYDFTDGLYDDEDNPYAVTNLDPNSKYKKSQLPPGIFRVIGGLLNGVRLTSEVIQDPNGDLYQTYATNIIDQTALDNYRTQITNTKTQNVIRLQFTDFDQTQLYDVGNVIELTDAEDTNLNGKEFFIMGAIISPLKDFLTEYVCYDKITFPEEQKEDEVSERISVVEEVVVNHDDSIIDHEDRVATLETLRGTVELQPNHDNSTNAITLDGFTRFNDNTTDRGYFYGMIPMDLKTGGKVSFFVSVFNDKPIGTTLKFSHIVLQNPSQMGWFVKYVNNWNGEAADTITFTTTIAGNSGGLKLEKFTLLADSTAFLAGDMVYLDLRRDTADTWNSLCYIKVWFTYEKGA
jgi:hypothetical protein